MAYCGRRQSLVVAGRDRVPFENRGRLLRAGEYGE
jgi:hypothetical protein